MSIEKDFLLLSKMILNLDNISKSTSIEYNMYCVALEMVKVFSKVIKASICVYKKIFGG